MEGRKQSSSSSFTTDLFGSKDSPVSSSSTGIFNSIFAPSSPKVLGRESLRSAETVERKQDPPATLLSNSKTTAAENIFPGENQSKEVGSYYNEEKVQPCHLSSSIYYGGQDVYSNPQSQSSVHTTFSKDTGEDDSGLASRGNWWQGNPIFPFFFNYLTLLLPKLAFDRLTLSFDFFSFF
ncbi:hypothetical protein M9H77_03831 [Catharanthus roseus]|uniref:Uncharacterized protein n=1 Tax=Catharanthus roseus TaxID=4058 RepID=A0ACC0CCV8_CATRO|nr:hypothetical protein M9H77_03831 [Catharanthus roseus]